MRFDVRAWFTSHFPRGKPNSKGDRIRHACPFHNDSPSGGGSFVVFLPKGNWVCKADSCAKKGSFALLFKEVEKIDSWAEVYEKLDLKKGVFSEEELGDASSIYGSFLASDVERVCPLPNYGLVPVEDEWPVYLKDRGYDRASNIAPYGLLWSRAGTYKGCLVFPFWDEEGQYKSYTARLMSFRKAEGRYFGPDGNTNDKYLYGAHLLRTAGLVKRLVVVEGQFDVLRMWTYGEYVVGLNNKDASPRQLLRIYSLARRHGCPVAVMLDGSAAEYTEALTVRINNLGDVTAYPAFLPVGMDPDKAPYELTRKLLDASSN